MTRRVLVDFEGSELPEGEVIAPSGCRTAFTGWIELAAALEAARLDLTAGPRAENDAHGGLPRE
jgi:hypothetical protein